MINISHLAFCFISPFPLSIQKGVAVSMKSCK